MSIKNNNFKVKMTLMTLIGMFLIKNLLLILKLYLIHFGKWGKMKILKLYRLKN
jgi:hypothetical protein